MPHNRPKLSLKLGDGIAAEAPDSATTVRHAIQHQLCARATYNRGLIILGPHILYERHGEPFVDGVVLERDGIRPDEQKLGTFKLAGLRNVVMTSEPYRCLPGFDPADERYAEKTIARLRG
jgi:hypothetical protein